MNAKELVDSLFEGYEQTAALVDFKEELLSNLNAKIENLVKKGMETEAAFAKAGAELGDVSALADELALKKRKEVFGDAYMDIRNYMSAKRVAAYVIFGILAFFGIIAALIAFFAVKETGLESPLGFTAFFAAMLPFLTAAVAGFTFLGTTQETVSMYPVSSKRGVWYAAAAGLIAFGLFTMPVIYFGIQIVHKLFGEFFACNFTGVISVMAVTIPFLLPGGGLLTFLILTEKNRLKPWAKDFHTKAVKQEMEMWIDYESAARFGLFSGAIWIFAVGIFILLGFLIGFKFSWLVFIFAVAIQLLVQGIMSRKKN